MGMWDYVAVGVGGLAAITLIQWMRFRDRPIDPRSILDKWKDAVAAWKRGLFSGTPPALPDVLVAYEMVNLQHINTTIHYAGRVYGYIDGKLYDSFNGKFHIHQPLDGPEVSDEEVKDAKAVLMGILEC